MFCVGQQVMCIRACPGFIERSPWFCRNVVRGEIYRVRGFFWDPITPAEGMYFHEITNRIHNILGIEFGYPKQNFRPLASQELSAVFITGADPSSDVLDNRRKQPAGERV